MDEIEVVKCECCGLKEECTKDYISEVKANFDAKWLCGLCSQAVGDEILFRSKNNHHSPPPSSGGIQDAVNAHMLFCRKFKSNPAVRVADAMKQILRRRSTDLSSQSSSSSSSSSTTTNNFSTSNHSTPSSQVSDMSSFSSLR
ncbi:pre-mRNA-splicing factor CWC22 homolog [Benincasa hispida]|uniref:pre-mRNA-splicing factor CWC22 homolog n=1 Tax=Benincasa hispida TaxID=102211 RepID=UPI0018FFA586|nr:pre-mRNA-splicing factor CWC22 homolog [Benincasa hispida]